MLSPLADPERQLALSYSPRGTRPQLHALWALDERLGAIVSSTSEPAIGEMRLLWWRESIERLSDRVPDEPLLLAIAEAMGGRNAEAADWGALAEGWYALLHDPLEEEDLTRFATNRGGLLFSLSAEIVGGRQDGLVETGARWALADFARHSSNSVLATKACAMARAMPVPVRTWHRRLRALGALAGLAERDLGRCPEFERPGSPMRIANMVWHRLSGQLSVADCARRVLR